ncbi:hypothetical protein [Entomospira culicis]|uniref:Uncharacterized protein n=1 Tax=Entomospira culicis TaxID=2719989 RepID=A0A968KV17_9SPIO|nr:hypothetical protein [Entomospira culicis]NIZ19899.1 hypothetical protein [Entomospira culicis]NIZ70144.1 hypothetical protein [Entomospira culicis]WDI38071.1 hypothetical protein PVA46_07985 [Entomospira culicis]WDI39694.1 hypothetical protein PVA47_07985 [Entomospira culicis]
MPDDSHLKHPKHPVPNAQNYSYKFFKSIHFLLLGVALIALIMAMVRGDLYRQNPKFTLQPSGVQVQLNDRKAEPLSLLFGMSVSQVRDLLGMESLLDEQLYLYSQLGLALFFDAHEGLRVIAYFSNDALNPLAIGSTWSIDHVRFNAGFVGSSFRKMTKNLQKVASLQEHTPAEVRFLLYSNTLQLHSDQRDRVTAVIYTYQDYKVPSYG